MAKNVIFTIALLSSICAKAQHWQASLLQGAALSANNNTDSLFFAKQHNATQVKVGYQVGKLSAFAAVTTIGQKNATTLLEEKRLPLFVQQQTPKRISNLRTWQFTAGLQLCIPIIPKKVNVNFYSAFGISCTNSDSIGVYDATFPLYVHKANGKKFTSCWQTGLSFLYKINNHFGLRWQNEWNQYCIAYNGVDARKIPSTIADVQKKNLFISYLGMQYSF